MGSSSNTEPLGGTVTVRVPVVAPKSPDCATLTFTVTAADGGGDADTVNTALLPSVTCGPAVIDTSGGVTSSLVMVTVVATPSAW